MNNFASLLKNHCLAISFLALIGSNIHAAPVLSEIFSLGAPVGQAGHNHIYRIDIANSNAVIDLGSTNINTPGSNPPNFSVTNLAFSSNRKFYYMNPYEEVGGGHKLYSATMNSTSTLLTNVDTLVALLPTAGLTPPGVLNIIDGLTVGPNGDLYMTGYGKNAIYRYNVLSGAFTTEVHLAPGTLAQYRADLAFDPITGNLVGLGIQPNGSTRTLFEIASSLLTNGVDDADTWHYFGGLTSAWAAKALDTNTELGGNPDGIAFDPTSGDLFMSGDGTGIYSYGRNTAIRGNIIPGTATSYLNGLGFDLAAQTIEVPEPGTVILVFVGFLASLSVRRPRPTQS